jgi:hypothetical protein
VAAAVAALELKSSAGRSLRVSIENTLIRGGVEHRSLWVLRGVVAE